MNIREILEYLNALKANNNRDWFQANKKRYDEAKKHFEEIVFNLIKEVSLFDHDIGNLEPKDCTFRIYRDVRFGKDKSPYKTNMGGFIVKGGRKSGNAGYYLHLDPDESFIGGGSHMPQPASLKNIRMDICQYTDEFLNIIDNKHFKETFGNIEGDKLVKSPKGFPEDFVHPELIKFKSYTVGISVTSKEFDLPEQEFIKYIVDVFKTMQPFIKFLNRAINAN